MLLSYKNIIFSIICNILHCRKVAYGIIESAFTGIVTQDSSTTVQLINEDTNYSEEAKLFENIKETQDMKVSNARSIFTTSTRDDTLGELKTILLKMLCKLDNIGSNGCKDHLERKAAATTNSFMDIKEISERITAKDSNTQLERSDTTNERRRPRWGHWTAWSSCSVTCGKGREIRWRHCHLQCDTAETEMEEKTCQLPACAPKHMFGI